MTSTPPTPRAAGASRVTALLLLSLAAATCIRGGGATFTRGRALPRMELLKLNKLRIYGSSVDDYAEYLLEGQADDLLRDRRFDAQKPTVLYFHGYTEHADKESVRTVMSAFIAQGRYNPVLVDWSRAAAEFYVIPLLLVPEVGRGLARRLDAWHATGALPIAKLYLVGHSLGGQAAGFTGKFLTKDKVPRITALDPALPGFNAATQLSRHVATSDALFVDVIHTDGGNYGVAYATGHADFFPNGGKRLQPGCPPNARMLSDEDFCSHWRSWRFFAESLDPSMPPYYALACGSQADFVAGRCAGNEYVVMGYATPNTTRGTFYLETTSTAPYAKAEAGLKSTITAKKRNPKRKPRRRFFWLF